MTQDPTDKARKIPVKYGHTVDLNNLFIMPIAEKKPYIDIQAVTLTFDNNIMDMRYSRWKAWILRTLYRKQS